jgi:hypothetical protein
MFARRCERRCIKRISNIVDDRDACFFWAAHRLAASACRFLSLGSFAASCILARFLFGRAVFVFFLFITLECNMLKRVRPVRAARRRGKAKEALPVPVVPMAPCGSRERYCRNLRGWCFFMVIYPLSKEKIQKEFMLSFASLAAFR